MTIGQLTISVREAARRTGAPVREIEAACEAGELRACRKRWGWLVYPDALEEWVGLAPAPPSDRAPQDVAFLADFRRRLEGR